MNYQEEARRMTKVFFLTFKSSEKQTIYDICAYLEKKTL